VELLKSNVANWRTSDQFKNGYGVNSRGEKESVILWYLRRMFPPLEFKKMVFLRMSS
jgi:hypothetical protein